MDVKLGLLDDDIEDEFYMNYSEMSMVLGKEDKICKIRKPLYGLKQAQKNGTKIR